MARTTQPRPRKPYTPVAFVDVHCWGRHVGRVAPHPTTGAFTFAYHPDWVASGVELAPTHMPLRAEPYEFSRLPQDTYYGLPPLLADALPDRFGNALVNAWMAEQGLTGSEVTPLDRLAYAGTRAMGALVFEPPASGIQEEPSIIQIADLVLAARATVNGSTATDASTHDALQHLIQVGTSAGGARAKAVILYNRATGQVRSGHAPHQPGYDAYLLKLDGVSTSGMDGRVDRLGATAQYGRIEYAYHLMALDAGVDMAPSELLPEGPRAHFLTQRFDRGHNGERHHMITLCALAHLDFNQAGAHSYDQYLQTVRALGLGPDALAQAYRRMVFNVYGVNRDDHTKNLAFLRRENSGWELSPAYDVTHAYNPSGHWTATHQMRVNGKVEHITVADLHAVGDRHDVPAYRRIVREIADAVTRWPAHAARAGVDADATETISDVLTQFRPA